MIVTCRNEISRSWIAVAVLPWAAINFAGNATGVAFLFSIKKFIENPAGITFLLSLPQFLSLIIAPVASALSDTVWTRFGRRKPFVIISWLGLLVCMVAMPLAPNWWSLVAIYLAFGVFSDLGTPIETLKQEIVPPPQRGRATAAMAWVSNLVGILFYSVALGRFDDVTFMAGFPVSGEAAIYWIAALLLLVVLLIVTLGVKETDPHSPLAGKRITPRDLFFSVFSRDLWPVYLLVFATAMLNAGLGPLGNLISTEQFGFTKQDMGNNIALGGVLNIFIIGFLGIIADKLDRLRTYQVLIILMLALKVLYFAYIEYVLVDGRATVIESFVFGEAMSIIGILTGMIYTPLVYDYIRRNQMGAYLAGANLVSKFTSIATLNGVGLFVWAFAALFMPPAGDTVRIVLADPNTRPEEVRRSLDSVKISTPATQQQVDGSSLSITPWFATNVSLDSGSCWELRLKNPVSESLAQKREALGALLSELTSDRSRLTGSSETASTRPARLTAEVDSVNREIAAVSKELEAVSQQLEAAARDFGQQIRQALGPDVLADGAQVTSAETSSAMVVTLRAQHRPDITRLNKLLARLREADPSIIDLVPRERDGQYFIDISRYLSQDTQTADATGSMLVSTLRKEAGTGFLSSEESSFRLIGAVRLSLKVIEDPIDLPLSPIMRVAYTLGSAFVDPPPPDRRLAATARALRSPDRNEHVRLSAAPPQPGAGHQIIVLATVDGAIASPDSSDMAVRRRLESLLPSHAIVPAQDLYSRVVTEASNQRLTVARPVIYQGYAPMKYDYMSGYIWTFIMAGMGLAITYWFIRQEKSGRIRKAGVEEVQAEAAAEFAIESNTTPAAERP